jgi:3-methyl-2-oxobutanoate hydroxymethyltransferase
MDLAAEISQKVSIPTIGIGAGPACDGQVLVLHDVLGLSERTFTFAKAFGNLRQQVIDATSAYVGDVHTGTWPDEAHSFR